MHCSIENLSRVYVRTIKRETGEEGGSGEIVLVSDEELTPGNAHTHRVSGNK